MATSKSTAKKSAASAADNENTETKPQTGRVGDSGPGTGVEAPEDETAGRYPSTVVNSDSAPLDPPADTHTQSKPEAGHPLSTTDNVYAEAGGRTVAGEDYSRLIDADGNDLSADALFDDQDASKTFVVTKTRIYEEFYYPNTNQPAKRLMFTEGRRVPRAQADRIKAALDAAPEPVAAQRAGRSDQGDQ